MKIVITTLDNLPEYCHDCPCCHDGYCKADKERREAQPYRPFWCPLREEKEESIPENSMHPGLIYSVPLHIEEEENIYIAKRGRCGKTVDIEIIGDMLIDYYNKKEEEKVSTAKCNRCGKIVRHNLTTIVKIIHGGTSIVNYPHNGKFRICKDCERWLLDELAYNKKEE